MCDSWERQKRDNQPIINSYDITAKRGPNSRYFAHLSKSSLNNKDSLHRYFSRFFFFFPPLHRLLLPLRIKFIFFSRSFSSNRNIYDDHSRAWNLQVTGKCCCYGRCRESTFFSQLFPPKCSFFICRRSQWNCEIPWASITPGSSRYCVVAIPRESICHKMLMSKARQQFPESHIDDVIGGRRLWRHFKVFGFSQFPSLFMSMWWTLHSERTMINLSVITSTVNGCDKLHFNWNFVAISIQSRARKKTFN